MENYSVEHVYPLSHLIIQDYLAKRYSQVRVVYTEFISALRQAAKVFTLLPLRLTEAIPATVRGAAARPAASPVRNKTEFSYEPSAQVLLDELLPSYIRARLYWSLLEVNASEHAARMLAMHSAAENAAAMMSELQLEYNQLRQLSITQELAEIMGGLAALK
jgi:F-type H+-transporting ATPase subunit gamma